MELNNTHVRPGGEIDHDDLAIPVRQHKIKNQAIGCCGHRFDPCAARDFDRALCYEMARRRLRLAVRCPDSDRRNERGKADDEHNTHHDNQDL